MKRLFKYMQEAYKPYKLYALIFFIGVIVDLAVEGFVALSFKVLIDSALGAKDEQLLMIVILLLCVSTLVANIGYVYRSFLYAKLSTGVVKDMRNRLFGKLQRLSVQYFSSHRTGDLMNHFSSDIASVEALVSDGIPYGVYAVIGVIINLAIIVYLEWKLALLAVFGLVLCALGPWFFSERTAKANDRVKAMEANLLSTVEENIGAQKVVKSFNLEPKTAQLFDEKASQLQQEGAKAVFLNELMEMTPNIIIEAINIAIICVGAWMAFKGYITAGTLVSFNTLFLGLSSAVGDLTQVFPTFMDSASSFRRIHEYLTDDGEMTSNSNAVDVDAFNDALVFSQVEFGYVPEQRSLNQVNLTIPKGKRVAFVGHSGSGKSSILNLMMRFYDPVSGKITLDGIDLKDMQLTALHRLMGIVLQDNYLFDMSIKANLKLVNPHASDEAIFEAAKAAEIHDTIMAMPEGYETQVGERGSLLTGGQRQRIAIARALLQKPQILVLDEATSALDPKTEQLINGTFNHLAGHMTLISITHRLEHIKDYDYIYVLDSGQIVEHGDHKALVQQNGIYAELIGKQGGFIIDTEQMEAEIEVERLGQIQLFHSLDKAMLEELSELFVSEYVAAGQNIIRAGDTGDRFYVIARGQMEVVIVLENGQEKVVNVLEDGDYFGEIALLKPITRTATIRARIPSLVLSLKRRSFERIISKEPKLRQTLEAEMDSRLAQLDKEKRSLPKPH